MYDAINDSRTRPAHAAMDGFVVRHDDPIWKIRQTPCGYSCRCRVISMTDKQAARFQAADARRMQDPELAAALAAAQPDKGWDYSVCAEPTEGLKRAYETRRQQCSVIQFGAKRGGWSKIHCQGKGADTFEMGDEVGQSMGEMPEPRRLDLSLLPKGQDERFYLERFMAEFGEGPAGTAILRDKTGQEDLAVSRLLFTDHKTGGSKIAKEGRSAYLLYLAKTIVDPDEILRHEGGHGDRALYLLAQLLLKSVVMNTIAVFKEDGKIWTGWSIYQTFRADYFESKRSGFLLYRRPET